MCTLNGRHVCFFSAAGQLCAQDDDPVHDIFRMPVLPAGRFMEKPVRPWSRTD